MLKSINNKKVIVFLVTIVVMVTVFLCVTLKVNATGTENKEEIGVLCVTVQNGDSLWKIAEKHYSPKYKSIVKYVEEIKKCNSLSNDTIRVGMNIIVPYYIECE